MTGRVLAVLAAAALLTGCGAAEHQSDNTGASAADRVDIAFQPDGPKGQTLNKTVTCTTVTDTCRKLRTADFSEPDQGMACTQQFGGPAVATVTGKAGGSAIKTTFELRNGCEIARWKRFAWLLGDPPLSG